VPVRYDRELVATTIKAMDRIAEIRAKREKAFWKNRQVLVSLWSTFVLTGRMSGNKARNLRAAATDIERHIELVQPRTNTAVQTAPLEEKERIREKIKVRAANRKAMAEQQLGGGKKSKKESRLIPAAGGGMGMGMDVE
jgi:large subunit ribosomal protein L24e